MSRYKRQIERWTLVPSDGGKFELSLNGKPIFSKLKEGRFPESGEAIGLIEKHAAATKR